MLWWGPPEDFPFIDKHLSVTIEQNSLINGPTSGPSLRACIEYCIGLLNRKPLWMTINGAGGGGGWGPVPGGYKSLSRVDGTKHKLVQGAICKSVVGEGEMQIVT